MKNYKNKIIIILGPTASGKTNLAVKLARDFNGEIISADSRQVYKYMDIGTGKDLDEYKLTSKGTVKRIKYHLIDVINPKSTYSVSNWVKACNKAIINIQKRNKLPIICGGTALYIYAFEKGYQLPKSNKKDLLKIRRKLDRLSLNQLANKLKQIDSITYKKIDLKNRRRVQRAIEIYKLHGKTKSSLEQNKKPNFDILKLGIKLNKSKLHNKINKRLSSRFEQGMIREIDKLIKIGVSYKKLQSFGLEYKWLSWYMQKKINYQQLVAGLSIDIKRFAKRQMTWFKKDTKIKWIKNYSQAKKISKQFLNK